ncbi:hypothetical protein GGG16DRAFT_128522 [Schizophyllum commune]
MSTIHDLTARLPEDDEEDPDFVPLPDEGQLFGHNSPDSEPELPLIENDVLPTHDDLEEKRRQRGELWSKFLAMDPPRPPDEPPRKLVKVVKAYKFAGKEMEEIIEVPEDSPDAAKWPRYEEVSSADASEPSDVPMADLTAQLPNAPPSQPPPPHKPPGPRRGKVSLPGFTMRHRIVRTPALPHEAGHTAHATNHHTRDKNLGPASRITPTLLTTLDKSALEWRSHIQSQSHIEDQAIPLRDELDAHRRGGGYLEKVAFMQRVEQRREGLLEAVRDGRRKRGG